MSSAKAVAPGKLILSGEHSVVYGAPAVAIAVDRYAGAVYRPSSVSDDQSLTFSSELYPSKSCKINQLNDLQCYLDQRFQRYLNNTLVIPAVIEDDVDLLFYAYAQTKAGQSGHISLKSNIPLGSGMGSSAAVIAAVLSLGEYLRGYQSDKSDFFQQVRYCERLQHGRGSVLDAAAVTYGGLVQVEEGEVSQLPSRIGKGWYFVDTGMPLCSTGETVDFVRAHFAESSIWQEFSDITEQLVRALHNKQVIVDTLKQNQTLLKRIGVVPEKVDRMVDIVERCGGAAKISGAGAHVGDGGGQLLVYLPDANVTQVASMLGVSLLPLKQSDKGAHVA